MRVIIAGADGALGQAVVACYRRAGHHVVELFGSPVEDDPERGLLFAGDLADEARAAAVVDRAVDLLGGVDAYVHLAGAFTWTTVAQSGLAEWRAMFDANLLTAVAGTRAVLARMTGGAIVLVGAAAAGKAGAGFGPYAASKSGVARLVEALSAETDTSIRVNAVLPLIIDTPRNRADMPGADPATWTSPGAVADAIHFLTSPLSRAIDGALVPVTNPAV